jgi:tetratricopeptide (TPR) repeat protein
MKQIVIILISLNVWFSYAQDKEKEQLLALKKANNYIFEANEKINEDDFISAEMEYRMAISEQPNTVAGTYNLGNSYYQKGNFEEALFRQEQAAKNATNKLDKHKAFHNIGNILMQNKMCKEAVEAYKNALRNDPTDDETRYNFVIAKECAEQQQQQQDQDQDQDKKDENKDDQDKKDQQQDQKDQNEDKGDQDKKEGDDQKDDQGQPKDDQKDQDKGNEDQKEKGQPKPKQGQLSPQQIKNLLEAMNNQEQKVQEKINAEKQKGVKIKTEKDW